MEVVVGPRGGSEEVVKARRVLLVVEHVVEFGNCLCTRSIYASFIFLMSRWLSPPRTRDEFVQKTLQFFFPPFSNFWALKGYH